MRILMLTTHGNIGGISSYLLTLVRGLREKGHEIFLVSSGGDLAQKFAQEGARVLIEDIRTKSELHPKIYLPLRRLTRLIRFEGIDVIHGHTRITQVMGSLLSAITKKPYVATCHGFYHWRLSRRLFPCWGDKVIAISPVVKDFLLNDFHVPASRVALIRNGVDVSRLSEAFAALHEQKRREFLFSQDPVIGMVARLADVKGHAVLIEAMPFVLEKFPRARVMIFGEGKMKQLLFETVNKFKLQDVVRFYPRSADPAEIYPLFDIFVMPSLKEGFGLSLIEAQAAGLPVVASRTGGIIDLVEQGKTGLLVEPGDPHQLAEAIIEILADREKARQMGLRARSFIKENYPAERMVKETIALYQDVISSREKGP